MAWWQGIAPRLLQRMWMGRRQLFDGVILKGRRRGVARDVRGGSGCYSGTGQ